MIFIDFSIGNNNPSRLIDRYLDPTEYGGVIIVKIEDSNTNLDKSIVDGNERFNMTTFPFGTENKFNLSVVLKF